MIVFYLIGFILILTLVVLLSSITVEIKKLKINDIHNFTAIIEAVLEKEYIKILENIEINIESKIKILNLIPIKIITIDSKKIISLIHKNNGKKHVSQNSIKFVKEMITDIINNNLQINKVSVEISLGLHNAHYTALMSTLLMIVIAIILNCVTENRIKIHKNDKRQEEYIKKNFKFKVNPIYEDKIVANFASSFKVTIKGISLTKEFLMYKSNLFVNNTNKYKVKES